MGGAVVGFVFGEVFAATIAGQVLAFAINMVISSIVSSMFAPDPPSLASQQSQPNPGNRQQAPPAGDNKLPVVYGSSYIGGAIIDMTISEDNQDIWWVFALCEAQTSSLSGSTAQINFGDVLWGGRKVHFDANGYSVFFLEELAGGTNQEITGYMDIYLYRDGSGSNAVNATDQTIDTTAYTIMGQTGVQVWKWTVGEQKMSNTAFAIVHMKYSQSRNLVTLNQTRFQVISGITKPGDVFYDYFTNTRYGAAIPVAQVDTASLIALNTYSDQLVSYTDSNGNPQTHPRFRFNGALLTTLKIMQNIQNIANCCDCLVKYNEITSKWGVIVQQPTYTVAMTIDDSNTIGGITVTPIDISNSFNIIECKYPEGSELDSFSTATLDLAQVDPALLFPNEPVNKQSVNLYLINDSVRAQYLANRMIKAGREDLQIQIEITYVGLQLEAGDIVSVTNANYGWTAKLFRISKVTQKFGNSGEITTILFLSEFNPSVYADVDVTQYQPSPNTGIQSPLNWGTVPAPTIVASYPTIILPSILIGSTASSGGITQYAEIWYSAYQYPTEAQRFFAGTTAIQPNGNPYIQNQTLPNVEISTLPAGDYYFFSKMVNALGESQYSAPSAKLEWRPATFQYLKQYISIAYADSIDGQTNFNLNPRNRLYYGICNQDTSTTETNPALYQWYLADPAFGSNIYLVYANRSNLKMSFDTDFATYASGTGAFVPTTASKFDPKVWSALPDGTNIIQLKNSTGQFLGVGNTTTGTGQIKISNTADGQVIASLDQFLDFGGPTVKTGSSANLTIDIYGRVVGFETPDGFYMTIANFNPVAPQSIFNVTRDVDYIVDQCWVFINGALIPESEYADSATQVILSSSAQIGDKVTIISFRAKSLSDVYANTGLVVQTVGTSSIVYNSIILPHQYIDIGNVITFGNTGSPTQYTVQSVNYATRTITFTTTLSGVASGDPVYIYRATNSSYRVFSRFEATLSQASSYTPTEWSFSSGYEFAFFNGMAQPDEDYDIVGNTYTNIPANATGNLSIIQFNQNNTTTPAGSPVNISTQTVIGQPSYAFQYTANALNLYANGTLLVYNVDYTTGAGIYTLSTTPTDILTTLLQQTYARAGAA